jgi:MFS family permease
MKPADQLIEFVGAALALGRPRDEIAAALRQADWQESEVTRALHAWAEGDFSPPVPRRRRHVSAREAFVYGLLFTALSVAVFQINSLGFSLIDLWLEERDPDGYADQWVRSYIRWSIAVLVVVIPLFLWMNWRQAQGMAKDPGKQHSAIRKWFGYVALFLAALGLVGDLIYTIYTLLNGDATLQFLLKAGLVLVTLGVVFLYYRLETEDADAP